MRCASDVKSTDKGLSCETCEKWFHIQCEDVTEDQYTFLIKKENQTLHWFCKDCETTTLNTGKVIFALKTKQESLEEAISKLRKEMFGELRGFEKEIHTLKATMVDFDLRLKDVSLKEITDLIDRKINERDAGLIEKTKKEVVPVWSEVVAKQVSSKFESVSKDMVKVQKVLGETKKKAEEEKDKVSRTNNIIIYRVPEEGDINERAKRDREFCLNLVKDALEVEIVEEDIKAVFRLGKKGESCRPLMVQFRTSITKNRVMESLYKLKDAETKYKQISITHDMTKEERIECKSLVEQAKKKQLEETGEFLWRVRGPPSSLKIIKIAKK